MWTIRPIDFIANQGLVTSTDLDADGTTEWAGGSDTSSAGDTRKVTTDANGASQVTYKIYRLLSGGTATQDPTADVGSVSPGKGEHWIEVGSVNEWAWANDVIADVSTKSSGDFYLELTPAQVVNAIALTNVTGNSVNITITSAAEGEVYNRDFDLTSYVGIDDWYEFLFEPLVRYEKVVVFDLPPYVDAVIEITISASGSDTSVGLVVVGQQLRIGETLYGSQLGIDNYSSIDFIPEVNRTVLTERTYSDYGRIQVQIEDYRLEAMRLQMIALLNTTTVWAGDKDDNGTAVFGIMLEMSIGMATKNGTIVDLEIGGAS
jgi:hypothetical protein